MSGGVGYGDIASLLASESKGLRNTRATGTNVPVALSSNWWELRSGMKVMNEAERRAWASGLESLDPLVRAWLSDDCPTLRAEKYAKYAWELDAWTEYWDIYHPETKGCYYFGSTEHAGFLNQFLPSPSGGRSPVFDAWKSLALCSADEPHVPALQERFQSLLRQTEVSEAVSAVDELVRRLLRSHFADERGELDPYAYLDAMERFGKDTLPECQERFDRIADDDPRKSTSLHHTIEADVMWFAWALHLECAQLVAPPDAAAGAERNVLMAGIALGCSFDYAVRRGYRTRKEYRSDQPGSWARIWSRSLECASDFAKGVGEVRDLFRIRTFGDQSA